MCLCAFDGSGVCSEPLLTSVWRTVTQLVQWERHSPSNKACAVGVGGGGVGWVSHHEENESGYE